LGFGVVSACLIDFSQAAVGLRVSRAGFDGPESVPTRLREIALPAALRSEV
jgi:hypothetical protein